MDPDPDPGGPKTCGYGGSGFGSGSATLFDGNPVLPYGICPLISLTKLRGEVTGTVHSLLNFAAY